MVSWTAHGRRLIANHPVVPTVRAVEAPVAAGGFDFAPVEGRSVAGSCWAALLVGAEGVAPRCFARAGLCGSAPEAARQQCHCSEGHAGFEALGGPAAVPQRPSAAGHLFTGSKAAKCACLDLPPLMIRSTERVPHCIDEWAALVTLRRSPSWRRSRSCYLELLPTGWRNQIFQWQHANPTRPDPPQASPTRAPRPRDGPET